MLTLSTILKHYKREDIQQEMLFVAQNREAVPRYGDTGFGKRPDVLSNPREILNYAQQGATSFHVSEEHWHNPMQLRPDLPKQEIEQLRSGWDLVIDVDCKLWNFAKLITHLLVQELYKHGIKSVSVKFSGGKGFHIGVPFEAFPTRVHDQDISHLFPEGVRRIFPYLGERIKPAILEALKKEELLNISQQLNIPPERILKQLCTHCHAPVPKETAAEFVCTACDTHVNQVKDSETTTDSSYKICPKCSKFMERVAFTIHCKTCKSTRFEEVLDITPILNMDTVLISSRHLYRMPYSLHEKTGLVSLPIDPEKILQFEPAQASPHNLVISKFRFLDTAHVIPGEGRQLLVESFDFKPKIEDDAQPGKTFFKKPEMDIPETALPFDYFPHCIKKGLEGLKDGKKRFVFILINFLRSVGWSYDQIEKLIEEWNQRNQEPLREVVWRGQLRYHQQQNKNMLPPNCAASGYYDDLGIRCPAEICGVGRSIKNPVQYAKRRVFLAAQQPKRKKKEAKETLDSTGGTKNTEQSSQ